MVALAMLQFNVLDPEEIMGLPKGKRHFVYAVVQKAPELMGLVTPKRK